MPQTRSILAGLILLGLAGQTDAQVNRKLSPEQEWQELVRQTEAEAAGLPVLKVESARKVVSFSVESGMLTARTLLPQSSFSDARLDSADLKGIVRFKQFVPVAGNGPSLGFQLIQQDLTSAAAGHINTMVSMAAGRLLISRDVENGQTLRSIQFLIDPPTLPTGFDDENPVRLLVNQSSLDAATNELKIQCSAKTFIELRFANRNEVDTYLRPIIRSFAQEQIVFAVPKEIAWQVLGRDEPVDPQAAARVRGLVDRLGSDDFRTRQTATDELKHMGQAAVWVLGSIDRNKLSLQQSAEVDSLLASTAPLPSMSFNGLDKDIQFLLDVLYSDSPTLRESSLKHLRELTGKRLELDSGLDADARAEAVAKLRQQLTSTTQPSK